MRLALLTIATLICFAANSLFTRAALGHDRIDPASFLLIRLATGALTLVLLAGLRQRSSVRSGSWLGSLTLAGYGVAFTFAYLHIGAAAGALLLFGAVQVTMIATGLLRGERPRRSDWIGVALAIGGLLILNLPGATSPDPTGALVMIVAGVCWGVYSIIGRDGGDALATTAGNFVRSTLLAGVAVGFLVPRGHWTADGLVLASASGALASGVGYTMWYTILPAIPAWRAAVLQLLVPVVTAALAALFLGESVTPRLLLAGAVILAGVGMTIVPNGRQR